MTKYIHNRAIFKTKDKPHMNWCININMIFYQVQLQYQDYHRCTCCVLFELTGLAVDI